MISLNFTIPFTAVIVEGNKFYNVSTYQVHRNIDALRGDHLCIDPLDQVLYFIGFTHSPNVFSSLTNTRVSLNFINDNY